MKLFIKTLLFIILTINVQAQVFSFYVENDVVEGNDQHYTNGISFSYLSERDTNNLKKHDNKLYDLISKIPTFDDELKYQSLGFTFSHLTFTPSILEERNKLINDLPYAGVYTLDFILYKWNEHLFHQYVLTLGLVGESTKTKQLQDTFHTIMGGTKPVGWNNQLKDDFLYNLSYGFAHKSYKTRILKNKLDITNSFKVDIGNYNRAVQIGSSIRYGKNYIENFNTVGRSIGANEHKLLNFYRKSKPSFGWSVAYGLAYSYTDYFYINDYDKTFENKKIGSTVTQVFSIDSYYKDYLVSFIYKLSNFGLNEEHHLKENYGGINISYLF